MVYINKRFTKHIIEESRIINLEAKDCQLYNEEVAQLRNKTLKTFLRFCVHIYCRFRESKEFNKSAKAGDFKISVSSSTCVEQLMLKLGGY